MILGPLTKTQKGILTSWLHYHNVKCGRHKTEDDWRAKHSVVNGQTVLNPSSKYGPEKFDAREARRHRLWCTRNGWAPYPEYLKHAEAWHKRQGKIRDRKETPREMAARILREKGLAPA